MGIEERQDRRMQSEEQGRSEHKIDSMPASGPSNFQLVLVAILVTALFMGPIALLRQLEPAGPWQMMPALALIIALESVFTRRWLDWPTRRRDRPLYSLAELAFLLMLTPLFLWLASGSLPLPTSISAIVANPLSLLSVELVLYMALVIIVWERAHSWSGLFIGLAITPDEVKYHAATSSERSNDRSIILPLTQRSALLRTFVQRWIAGGILLVVFVALATYDVRSAVGLTSGPGGLRSLTRLGMSQEVLFALLVYFFGGLVLISQGRMSILNGRWLADRSQRDHGIASKWQRWTLLLLAVLALLASFLPIGESFAFYRILQAIAGLVTTVVSLAVAIIAALFTLMIFLINAVLSPFSTETAPPPPPADLRDLLPASQAPVETGNLPSILAGSAFWLAVIAVAILATLHYLRGRGPGGDPDYLQRLWQRLKLWLTMLWSNTAGKAATLSPQIPWGLRRPSGSQGQLSRFRYLRVNALPPREQVRFLYISLVRQIGKRGLERGPAATPSEFAEDMKSRWPDSEADIEALTQAFVEARYSRRHVDRGRLALVKNSWKRIRRALSSRSRSDSS